MPSDNCVKRQPSNFESGGQGFESLPARQHLSVATREFLPARFFASTCELGGSNLEAPCVVARIFFRAVVKGGRGSVRYMDRPPTPRAGPRHARLGTQVRALTPPRGDRIEPILLRCRWSHLAILYGPAARIAKTSAVRLSGRKTDNTETTRLSWTLIRARVAQGTPRPTHKISA